MPSSSLTVKDAILLYLEHEGGTARGAHIIDHLTTEGTTTEGNAKFTLSRMVSDDILYRPKRGTYAINPHYVSEEEPPPYRPNPDADDADTFAIPIMSLVASAGDGAIAHDVEVAELMRVDVSSYAAMTGTHPRHVSILRASGDSMLPTITPGDWLHVARHHDGEPIEGGAIYVIAIRHLGIVVKRVQWLIDGRLQIISDNPAYPPETITPEAASTLRVIGKVVIVQKAT